MSEIVTIGEKPVFSDEQKKMLNGSLSKIARKHGCSHTYVWQIMNGNREINTSLSQGVVDDLISLLQFLTPKE